MNFFEYKNDNLFCEDVAVANVAEQVGTPLYLYSWATIARHFRIFRDAFNGLKHLICFSVKSNSNIAILKTMASEGGGADIVSGGELYRAIQAGIRPNRIVFSGVGKTPGDIEMALKSNILMFNVESDQELKTINSVAKKIGRKATIAVRINPDIEADTHPYIVTGFNENKFGIQIDDALNTYEMAMGLENIDIKGISCHIGSQLTEITPFIDALVKLRELSQRIRKMGINITFLDIGGGLGITYDTENPPNPSEYAGALKEIIGKDQLTLILEPGRVIIGNAGILVTRVIYTKSTPIKKFIIVDAGMNDLIRPSLYNSFHSVLPVKKTDSKIITADLVGPICETGDFFAKDRKMPSFKQGDLVALMSAGAYGFSMASNYNSRPRPAEVLVKEKEFSLIRSRETLNDLIRGETIPEFIN